MQRKTRRILSWVLLGLGIAIVALATTLHFAAPSLGSIGRTGYGMMRGAPGYWANAQDATGNEGGATAEAAPGADQPKTDLEATTLCPTCGRTLDGQEFVPGAGYGPGAFGRDGFGPGRMGAFGARGMMGGRGFGEGYFGFGAGRFAELPLAWRIGQWALHLLFAAFVVVGIVRVVAGLRARYGTGAGALLAKRFANGEISEEEYLAKKETLEN